MPEEQFHVEHPLRIPSPPPLPFTSTGLQFLSCWYVAPEGPAPDGLGVMGGLWWAVLDGRLWWHRLPTRRGSSDVCLDRLMVDVPAADGGRDPGHTLEICEILPFFLSCLALGGGLLSGWGRSGGAAFRLAFSMSSLGKLFRWKLMLFRNYYLK